MNLTNQIKDSLKQVVLELQNNNYFDTAFKVDDLVFLLSEPNIPKEKLGSEIEFDFSTNLAFILKKYKQTSPLNIANDLKLKLEKLDLFEVVFVTTPGFVNFVLKNSVLNHILKNIIITNKKYGANFVKKEKINVEYVSANPTGFLHVGHVRGAIFGDSLIRILRHAGHEVEAEYYVNDAGNQINILANSVLIRYKELFGFNEIMPQDSYHGEDIIWVAKEIKAKYHDYFLNDFNSKQEELKSLATNLLLERIKSDLARINVTFDTFSSEKALTENNLINPVLEKLKLHTYIKDQALFLNTTKFGDDKDRVLIKNDGKYTYLTPDIAYHETKLKKSDRLINVWGADHSGYVARMKISLQALGYNQAKIDILIMQLVRLLKNGQEFKMSKRAGTSVTLTDLLEVAKSDAIRFGILTREISSQYDFNIDQANLMDTSNPVYNVQYAHARTVSLRNNLKPFLLDLNNSVTPKARKVILALDEFPDLLATIVKTSKVNLLTQYLINLTNLFNSFYAQTRLINHPQETYYSALALSVQIVLRLGLNLLGVSAPNLM